MSTIEFNGNLIGVAYKIFKMITLAQAIYTCSKNVQARRKHTIHYNGFVDQRIMALITRRKKKKEQRRKKSGRCLSL